MFAVLPRGPEGLRHQVSLSVSSCSPHPHPHPGKPRWGEGRGRRGGHLTFGSPSPSLSGFLAGGKDGLPLLTVFLPAQESVSVGGEGPGLTAVQGWVGTTGPGQAQSTPVTRRHLLSALLALGERTWRAGSRPSSCREMPCARCRCYTGSTSPSRSGITWRSGLRASRGRCPCPAPCPAGP